MNKFGRVPGAVPFGRIDGISVRSLLSRYGSPLWVISEGGLRRKFKDFHRAFSLRYPRVVVAYSYKTNYLSSVCSILHQEGAWAEVVSGFEYDIALALKVPPERIIFNGPHKRPDEMRRAIAGKSRIHLDSFDEMFVLEEQARQMGTRADVGIRINLDVNYPPWDRFGFNLETGQAYEACKRVAMSEHMRLTGLHCHVGTFITDLTIYATMVEKIVAFAAALSNELGIRLDYLDMGGGYASNNTLHSQWLPAEQVVPTVDQYAEVICSRLMAGPFDLKRMPQLVLEPGRAIVDEIMYLLATVIASKRLPTGGKGLVLDAGVNLLPTSYWYRHEVLSAQDSGYINEEVTLYGPLCMNIDCLRLSVSLPPLRRGDAVVIKNVGAYNFTQSMQFIQPRPAIVLINEGAAEVVRQAETADYLRQLEVIPDRLWERPSI